MRNFAIVTALPKSLEAAAEMEETGAASLCRPNLTILLLKQFSFPFFPDNSMN
ncbi:MAG: hypothetical protein WAL45_19880 [Terracidiphilus sp.]